MLVSVITPSHRPDHLAEVWACLRKQTYPNFEWVVVANGDQADAVQATVEHLVDSDPRVRLLRSSESNVGALKRFACESALGDLFLEYDHDDLIVPTCLDEVVGAAQAGPRACFLYSEDITCRFDHSSDLFMKEFGWRQSPWAYEGRDYIVNNSFPITPRSLCEILYSPDHVRVWSREAYQITGGHNRDLRVGDDHDLMVRTYLKGITFTHIPKVLYLHRLKDDTTSQTSLEEIQQTSWGTRDRYLHALVQEWCRREALPMYDLGGAHNPPDGYIPVDTDPAVKTRHPDALCCDVLQGLPLEPNSVGCFRAFDFLEHVPIGQAPQFMNHLYELLVPGGYLLTMTPAVCDDDGRAGRGAFQDPTHCSFWSSNNFWYFTKRQLARFVPAIKCRFQTIRLFNGYPTEWHREHLIPYVWADLMALKDDDKHYFPGPREI